MTIILAAPPKGGAELNDCQILGALTADLTYGTSNQSAQWNAIEIALDCLFDESVGVGGSSNSDGSLRNRTHVLKLGELGDVGYSIRRQFRDAPVRGRAEHIGWGSFVNPYGAHEEGFAISGPVGDGVVTHRVNSFSCPVHNFSLHCCPCFIPAALFSMGTVNAR